MTNSTDETKMSRYLQVIQCLTKRCHTANQNKTHQQRQTNVHFTNLQPHLFLLSTQPIVHSRVVPKVGWGHEISKFARHRTFQGATVPTTASLPIVSVPPV